MPEPGAVPKGGRDVERRRMRVPSTTSAGSSTSISSYEKDRNLERATLVHTLGPAKEVYTGMRRASLRVIIRVPEVGDANKREGGAIVGVWVHASG
jgi:hypothetical protein